MKIRCFYRVRLLRVFRIEAITLYPFILFVDRQDQISKALYRHELQHIFQIQKLGCLRFYSSYLKSYFLFRMKGFGHQQAYLQIPYEQEAREAEAVRLTSSDLRLLNLSQSS